MTDLEAMKRFVRDVEAGRFEILSMRHASALAGRGFSWVIVYDRKGQTFEGEATCAKTI